MTRAGLLTAVTMLSVGVLCACSSFRPRASSTSSGGQGGVLQPGASAGRGRRLPGGAAVGDDGRIDRESRRSCRKGSRAAGWIAIAYVKGADGDCPGLAPRDSGATVAVLVYYANRPLDDVLDVCADERVPRGWTIDETDADASDACPGAERKGSSTVRIRRVR
ncbi:MAG TPA: hypothetical protein VF461_16570 [Gemmatimonadaceae bacterium]